MTSKLLLLFALCSLSLASPDVIIKSDLSGEFIVGGDTVTENTFDYEIRSSSFPISGAIWIWGPDWSSPPAPDRRIFKEVFNLYC